VKPVFLIALSAALAAAEPHPGWWAYVSPDSTAVVGIQRRHLRHSPFAAAIEGAVSPSGALGFPDLDCLRQASEMIIASPHLLAVEAGSFPVATVQDQAQRLGLHALVYRDVTLWLPQQPEALGVARISDQLVLVGAQKTLQAAIDNGLAETTRPPSALLTRTIGVSQTADLWVVAAKLPEPLAGLFVPLDADASEFVGHVELRGGVSPDGILVEASFDARSQPAAEGFIQGLRERSLAFPAIARGLALTAGQNRVAIALQANSEDLAAVLPLALAARSTHAPEPSSGVAIESSSELAEGSAPAPVVFVITHVEASQPRPVEAIQPRIVHIFNLEEGTRDIVLPPRF